MRMITSAIAVATLSAMMGGMSLTASAQPGPGGPGMGGPGMGGPAAQGRMAAPGAAGERGMPGHHPHAMGDPAEHLKSLRADIGITDAQAAAWDAYAKVVQDTATTMRADRGGMNRHAFLEMSTQDRLALLMKRRDQREQAMTAVKTAADALLQVLNDTQKVRALMSLPGLAPMGMGMKHHAMRHGH